MHLPDINVWLALAFEAHAHHRPAADWFDQQEPEACAFCRLTQQGLLRLATNPAVFGDEALSMARAWACYDALLGDERVYFREEPTGLEDLWRKHSRHFPPALSPFRAALPTALPRPPKAASDRRKERESAVKPAHSKGPIAARSRRGWPVVRRETFVASASRASPPSF